MNAGRLGTREWISIGFFAFLLVWWVILFFVFGAALESQNLYWAATYQLMAWWGSYLGLVAARPWGYFKSMMGRAMMFFAIGIMLQGFGQSTFSMYTTLLGVELPYPSIADVGYFGSVIFYLLGIASLARVAGVSFELKEISHKIQALFIPAVMLVVSYVFFLKDYEVDWSAPLRIALDLGYPLGEALYVALAIVTLLLSRKILGGIMRLPLMFLVVALIAQYAAEFNFLYQAYHETWLNGGYGDALYLVAYFLMAMSLAQIMSTLRTHHELDAKNI